MEFSLAVEQVNFDADDIRCNRQNIDSFSSLVNYNSEFQNSPNDSQNNMIGNLNVFI